MNLPPARSLAERKADTLAKLRAANADLWVATASVSAAGEPDPYLVPLSFAWIDEHIVLAVEVESRTARNATTSKAARFALGHTRDVVMVDAELVGVHPLATVPGRLADGYADQADWDPRSAGAGMCYLVFAPRRIQAWREVNELAGRTLMVRGVWKPDA